MILFIVNPVAGNGAALPLLPRIRQFMEDKGLPFEIVETQYPRHAKEIALQRREEFSTIVAVGGDGTVHETAAGLVGSETAMGVLACGTGNDLIKSMGIPAELQSALEVISAGKRKVIDTGTVDEYTIINVAGIGFDVDVVKNTQRYKKRYKGFQAYILGLIRSFLGMKKSRIRVTADGQDFEGDTFITTVANGRLIGGGMLVAPNALMDDGLFDVASVMDVPLWKVPFLIPGFIKGTYLNLKYTHHFRAEAVEIYGDFPVDCEIDGEVVSLDRLNFRLQKHSLYILVP